jgi:hypothetical protein
MMSGGRPAAAIELDGRDFGQRCWPLGHQDSAQLAP